MRFRAIMAAGVGGAVRRRTAAIEMNAEYLVYLEPDNTIHRAITHEPDSDAGGMRDNNPRFGAALVKMVEEHVRKQQPTSVTCVRVH